MGDVNKLQKITDSSTIINLLGGTKEESAEVYVWKLLGSSKHLGQVRIEAIRKLRQDFSVVPSEGQDRIVQDLMSGQNFIDLYVPEAGLLFRCQVKTTDAPFRYYLQIPEFIAQVERRKSYRLNVHEDSEVKINFSKSISVPRPMTQHFLKDCFDISSGGFSFLASKIESKFFLLNDRIDTVEIKIGKWASKIGVEVITIRELEPDEHNGLIYKVWRISCRFTVVDPLSRKQLEKYIFERIKSDLRAINE